jgi:hypothetical protein
MPYQSCPYRWCPGVGNSYLSMVQRSGSSLILNCGTPRVQTNFAVFKWDFIFSTHKEGSVSFSVALSFFFWSLQPTPLTCAAELKAKLRLQEGGLSHLGGCGRKGCSVPYWCLHQSTGFWVTGWGGMCFPRGSGTHNRLMLLSWSSGHWSPHWVLPVLPSALIHQHTSSTSPPPSSEPCSPT